MIKLEEYTNKLTKIKDATKDVFNSIHYPFKEYDKNEQIHLVFVGQYSAGKSSILSMLTGRRDIQIGEGITTQKTTSYDWNGIQVIDTPGIHSELRPDHDEISYKAIAAADMLVYVVTNEGFDDNIANRFRNIAIEKDKAGEMILVINKMTRTQEGNIPEQQQIIKKDMEKVLAPYTPDQLNISFLDAESYLDSLTETDKEIADELKKRSGYDQFIETLNNFISEKNIASKLTTELYQIDNQIQNAIREIEPKQEDEDIKALEENYRQQRFLLVEGRNSIKQDVSDIFIRSASEIRNIGLDSANIICKGCKEHDVELELQNKVSEVQRIIEKSQDQAKELVETKLNELKVTIDELENSEFSTELKTRLNGKFSGLPENVKKVISQSQNYVKIIGDAAVKNSYNAAANGGLKLCNFSGSNVHDIVLKAGHTLGHKFKPWEAIKITKGVAVAGQVLSVLGVVFSVGMQIYSDAQEEKIIKDLEHNRQNVRSSFNSAANDFQNFGRDFVKEVVNKGIDASIQEIDGKLKEIANSFSSRNTNCEKLYNLQSNCIKLIQEIHNN